MSQLKLYKRGWNWARWSMKTWWFPGPRDRCIFERWLDETPWCIRAFWGCFWAPDLTDWLLVQTRFDWTMDANAPELLLRLRCGSLLTVQHDDDDRWWWWRSWRQPLCSGKLNQVTFDLWTNKTSGEKVKVRLTPHWIAAIPAAPLRRLTLVYILKRKNFRIVFSVSNPFLTLASINIWIFKALNSLSPLPSVWPLTCLVAFWHLCFALLLFCSACVYIIMV